MLSGLNFKPAPVPSLGEEFGIDVAGDHKTEDQHAQHNHYLLLHRTNTTQISKGKCIGCYLVGDGRRSSARSHEVAGDVADHHQPEDKQAHKDHDLLLRARHATVRFRLGRGAAPAHALLLT